MRITKFGHCCLLLEIAGKRILTDPGRFSTEQNSLTNIDIILITHEHADHYHSESIAKILTGNPSAVVVTNTSVATLLESLGVSAVILDGQAENCVQGVELAAYDGEHVEIFKDFGLVQNTGYLVAGEFFFPGDAYTIPDKPVRVLALPVAGPWCKLSEAITYALAVQPQVTIPVHDATLSEAGKVVTYPHCVRELDKIGAAFLVPEVGETVEV